MSRVTKARKRLFLPSDDEFNREKTYTKFPSTEMDIAKAKSVRRPLQELPNVTQNLRKCRTSIEQKTDKTLQVTKKNDETQEAKKLANEMKSKDCSKPKSSAKTTQNSITAVKANLGKATENLQLFTSGREQRLSRARSTGLLPDVKTKKTVSKTPSVTKIVTKSDILKKMGTPSELSVTADKRISSKLHTSRNLGTNLRISRLKPQNPAPPYDGHEPKSGGPAMAARLLPKIERTSTINKLQPREFPTRPEDRRLSILAKKDTSSASRDSINSAAGLGVSRIQEGNPEPLLPDQATLFDTHSKDANPLSKMKIEQKMSQSSSVLKGNPKIGPRRELLLKVTKKNPAASQRSIVPIKQKISDASSSLKNGGNLSIGQSTKTEQRRLVRSMDKVRQCGTSSVLPTVNQKISSALGTSVQSGACLNVRRMMQKIPEPPSSPDDGQELAERQSAIDSAPGIKNRRSCQGLPAAKANSKNVSPAKLELLNELVVKSNKITSSTPIKRKSRTSIGHEQAPIPTASKINSVNPTAIKPAIKSTRKQIIKTTAEFPSTRHETTARKINGIEVFSATNRSVKVPKFTTVETSRKRRGNEKALELEAIANSKCESTAVLLTYTTLVKDNESRPSPMVSVSVKLEKLGISSASSSDIESSINLNKNRKSVRTERPLLNEDVIDKKLKEDGCTSVGAELQAHHVSACKPPEGAREKEHHRRKELKVINAFKRLAYEFVTAAKKMGYLDDSNGDSSTDDSEDSEYSSDCSSCSSDLSHSDSWEHSTDCCCSLCTRSSTDYSTEYTISMP